MAFSKFFGRGRGDAQQPPAEPEVTDDAEATADDDVVGEAGEPELAPQRSWLDRAEASLPTGASTGSKRAAALYGEPQDDLPTHFLSARGALVRDTSGYEYVDCSMALGAVALGYAEPRVTQAVIDAASQGNVSALSSWREVELAERLCSLMSFAERAQILKTGAEATMAAVRLARAYTGRDHVIGCGYFGWHDWSSAARGVPAGVTAGLTRVPFNDIAALERAVTAAGTSLAAIVLEPVVDEAPDVAWLTRARELCDSAGAALVFDEVKTGFRVAVGGWQELCGVTPDLASYGKAMANGYPVAAVVGRQPLMDCARDTWISSTLASESTALAAAIAVLDWHEEADICASLGEIGREMRASVDHAIEASGLEGIRTMGIDQMWQIKWDDPALENRFVAEAMRQGVLFKRGAYNYAAIAHDEAVLRDIESAASAALVSIRESQ
jgi:glutamate-1-semialdehyde 2,1-aminomutase